MNKPKPRQVAFSSPTGFLAFGFGSGLSPKAPGTAGSLAALPFGILLCLLPLWLGLVLVAAAFAAGVYLCGATSRRLGVHDHPGIVWDEFVGLWLVMIFLPFHWAWWLAAFVAFRVFDIFKPWPIRWLDEQLAGGFGIMADDALAGMYALLVLISGSWIFSQLSA